MVEGTGKWPVSFFFNEKGISEVEVRDGDV